MSSTLHLEGQTRYFIVLDRHTIKLDKNKMDSKFIKSHQCSLTEIYHAVFWLKLILNSDQDLLEKKQILTGLLVTKIYKYRTMKISLFNSPMLGYISPITTSLPDIYRRNSCPTHIFKPTHQTSSIISPSNISDKFTIIWDLCRFLQSGLNSCTIFRKKLDFPSVNHITDT